MDNHIMRCGIISSCQATATHEIVQGLLVTSLTHVSRNPTFTFTFTFHCQYDYHLLMFSISMNSYLIERWSSQLLSTIFVLDYLIDWMEQKSVKA